MPDGRALKDGHMDEGWDSILLRGCLRGGGACLGWGGDGRAGGGILVAGALSLLLLSPNL